MQFSQEHTLNVQSKVNLWVTLSLPDSPLHLGAGARAALGIVCRWLSESSSFKSSLSFCSDWMTLQLWVRQRGRNICREERGPLCGSEVQGVHMNPQTQCCWLPVYKEHYMLPDWTPRFGERCTHTTFPRSSDVAPVSFLAISPAVSTNHLRLTGE